jgi:hypothetical protein
MQAPKAMSEDDLDDIDKRRANQQEVADRLIWKRAKRLKRELDKSIARLWISNAGGVVVTVNYLGNVHNARLTSIYLFLIGLIILSAITIVDIYRSGVRLRSNQFATSLLSMTGNFHEYPTERAGFTALRLIGCIASAICFAAGCIAGLVALS